MRDDKIYEHYPVGIEEFICSSYYLNAGNEVWDNIKNILKEMFDVSPYAKNFSRYTEFVYDGGIGSGKSFITSAIAAYVIYRLLCFRNPQEIYGLSRGSTIACLNMSKSANQAKKIVFSEIKARIENSGWFQKYGMPDQKIQSELRFNKNIVVIPGNSQETFPLGYNIIVANMDEASFYTDTEEHDVAEEMFNALSRRLVSRFGRCGLLCITSSPRYIDDFTERKVEEAKSNYLIKAVQMPTWESNPFDIQDIKNGNCFELKDPKNGDLVKIPNKYKSSFMRNQSKAWRDFGARASLVLEPYFNDEIGKLIDIFNLGYSGELFAGMPYFVHVDLGLKRDGCGFAMGHYRDGIVYIDLIKRILCRVRGESSEYYDELIGLNEVDFDGVRDLIRELKNRGFNIQCVSYDSWQSIDSRQQLEKEGFLTKVISVDRDTVGYDTLKSLINTKKFMCVNHPFFLKECQRLELVKGKKIDHPPNGSKDCSDAVAGVCQSIFEYLQIEVEDEIIMNDNSIRVEITPQI